MFLPPVEGLKVAPVDSYESIENKMEEGTQNRTVAATQMNATSSRAHTIVGISLVQKFKNAAGEETTKSANVNLVDLAGRFVYTESDNIFGGVDRKGWVPVPHPGYHY